MGDADFDHGNSSYTVEESYSGTRTPRPASTPVISTSKPKSSKSSNESCKERSLIIKAIPSYITCFATTGGVGMISTAFVSHCIFYNNLPVSLAIIYVMAMVTVTFVGTFKTTL